VEESRKEMIDPITISAAFAIAKSTIAGVQEAIQMGKDLQECSGDLIKFFEMRDTVTKAATQDKGKKPRSDMGQALDTVMQAKALRDAEKNLKEQLIYSGQGDVWEAIQAEYNMIQANRRREERETEAAAKHKREQLAEMVEGLFYGLTGCIVGGLICWGTVEFIIYKMRL
jgi:hypothetical protein